MCLTIPGRIERIEGDLPMERTAVVNFEGSRRTVHLIYLPEARVGEYVLVQAGFAMARIAESEALEALALARAPLTSEVSGAAHAAGGTGP